MNLGGVVHLNKPGLCLVLTVFALFLFYFISKSAKTSVAQEESIEQIDLNKLLYIAIKAAQSGGQEILRVKDNLKIDSKGKTDEGINDPVTTADYKSHCAMLAILKHQYSHLLVVSEEAKTQCDIGLTYDYSEPKNVNLDLDNEPKLINTSDLTIWIDPLDATKEFTEKLYQYVTTMVCVAIKGDPIIGIIHKPFENKTYWAWVGKKARQLDVGLKNINEKKTKVIVSMSHSGTIKELLVKSFEEIDVVAAAGAGYKVLEVVAGRADAYVHSTKIKKWDICAGNAILNAIGGKMSTKTGEVIKYFNDGHPENMNGLVATVTDHEKFIGTF